MRGSALNSLVGRDEEIDLLLRRWVRAKTGDGQVVLILRRTQPRPDRPLGVVLMRARVTEIGQTPSSIYLATPIEGSDNLGDGAVDTRR